MRKKTKDRMWKRILAMFFAVVLTVSMVPAGSYAAPKDTGIADVGRMSVEGLTGDGNILNTGGRMNAVERTVERLEYTGKAYDKQQN